MGRVADSLISPVDNRTPKTLQQYLFVNADWVILTRICVLLFTTSLFQVLQLYNEVVRRVTLSGPSSLAPIIRKAVDIVHQTGKYHILVIITDGQITRQLETVAAVVEASAVPLSIVAVGVGDGPWSILERFDARLPYRKFDNFRFVDYHRTAAKTKYPDLAFALQAMMEIPDQYKCIKELGYLEKYRSCRRAGEEENVEGGRVWMARCTTKSSPIRFVETLRHRSSNPL